MVDTAHKMGTAEHSGCRAALEEAFVCYQSELLGMLYHMVGNMEEAIEKAKNL